MHRLQKLLPFLALVVLAIALTIATPNFLTADNLASVVHQTTVINIIALGMTLVIITGGIDLSVGSILAIAGLLGTMSMKNGHSIPFAICVGLIVGLLCGLLNGVSISFLKINPFIVTLGTMGIFRGLRLLSPMACLFTKFRIASAILPRVRSCICRWCFGYCSSVQC